MKPQTQAVLTPPRESQRYAHYRDLSISYEGTSMNIPVRAPDISTRGMFINTAQRFPEGSVLRIGFRLSRTNVTVMARGEVRYCLAGVGVGIEFIALPDETRRAIEREVAATRPKVRR